MGGSFGPHAFNHSLAFFPIRSTSFPLNFGQISKNGVFRNKGLFIYFYIFILLYQIDNLKSSFSVI
jgi:hypothetical protein